MTSLISEITLAILALAALVFVFQVLRQRTEGQLSASSFPSLLLVLLIGWMATELVADIYGQVLGQIGRIVHFAVMVLVALGMTLQLRRSFRK